MSTLLVVQRIAPACAGIQGSAVLCRFRSQWMPGPALRCAAQVCSTCTPQGIRAPRPYLLVHIPEGALHQLVKQVMQSGADALTELCRA